MIVSHLGNSNSRCNIVKVQGGRRWSRISRAWTSYFFANCACFPHLPPSVRSKSPCSASHSLFLCIVKHNVPLTRSVRLPKKVAWLQLLSLTSLHLKLQLHFRTSLGVEQQEAKGCRKGCLAVPYCERRVKKIMQLKKYWLEKLLDFSSKAVIPSDCL